MFNAGVRGKRAKDGVGFLSTAEQFNQKSFLVPTVTSFSVTDVSYVPLDNTAVDTAGGETIVINGSGFAPGATVQVGATTIGSVTYIDQGRLAFAAPALSSGSYTIYVTNSNGGTGILVSGLVYSGLPTFSTSAGSLGTVYETANINTSVVATGDAPITYTLLSGTLPTGATLNSNGTITGNAPVDGSSTTYSFTIQASDGQLQDSTRAFTLTINTDVLTWSLANNTIYPLDGDIAMSNVTLSATSTANSNSAVTFAANTLPTGVSLSGNTIFGTPTVEQTVYSALTATATQTGRTATRFVSWFVLLNDAFWKNNTLLINGQTTSNSTFIKDASTNNFALTLNGDTRPNNFNPYTPGYYSNVFNNSSSTYLTVPNNAAFDFGTGDVTIESWVYHNATGVTQAYIATIPVGPAAGTGYGFLVNASGFLVMDVFVGATEQVAIANSNALVANRWYHVAYTRSSGTNRLFVDGNLCTTSSNTLVQAINSGGNTVSIGRQNFTGFLYPLNGYMSNLRIVKGTAVYTANFTPPTAPLTAISGTSLLTCQANRLIDSSTNNFAITRNGDVSVSPFDPFAPSPTYSTYGSTYFDGTGDYLTVPTSSNLVIGTNSFTLEAWVYPNSNDTYNGFVSSVYYDSSKVGISMSYDQCWIGTTSLIATYAWSSIIRLNCWNHLAISRDGTTLRWFVNGTLVNTTTNSTNIDSNAVAIGSRYVTENYTYLTNGNIADVRLVVGTAVYTASFTPPSSPLTAVSGTRLLTLQNNQPVNNNVFLDNSSVNSLITRSGNTTQGTFSPYGGNWSNYFDGTGDYLSVPSDANNAFGTGDFTIECWVFSVGPSPVNSTFSKTILDYRTSEPSTQVNLYYGGSGDSYKIVYYVGGVSAISSTGTAPENSWNHIALVRNSGVTKLYLNGTQTGSSYTDTNNFSASSYNVGGRFAALSGDYRSWYGYISNLHVTKGTALYTSTFTPSTKPLTPVANTSLLTCADNRIIDDSLNRFAITRNGDVSVQRFSPFSPSSVIPKSYSWHMYTEGSLQISRNETLSSLSTGAFTVEGWHYPTRSLTSRNVRILSLGRDSVAAAGNTSWDLYISNGSALIWQRINNTATTYSANYTFNINTWYHIVACRDSSGNLALFVNGTRILLQANVTTNYDFIAGSNGTHYIGATYNNVVFDYGWGYYSNIRVIKGATAYDPTQSTLTVPTTPLTITAQTSMLLFGNNGSDLSGNYPLSSITRVDSQSKMDTFNPFGFTNALTTGYDVTTVGGSAYFDGTGDYLSIPDSDIFSFGAGNFTIQYWINTPSPTTTQFIYGQCNSSALATSRNVGDNITSAGKLLTQTFYSSTAGPSITSSTTFLANLWYHIAIVRSGTTLYQFINGVLQGTANLSTNSLHNSTTTFSIGRLGEYVGSSFIGYISDFHIIRGTALYTNTFVPPVAPLTAVQNTVLLNNFTNAAIADYSTMNNLETVGDAKISTAVSKFGGSSMFFDGTGDSVSASRFLAIGTGDFTVETWFYLTAAGDVYPVIVQAYDLTFGPIIRFGNNGFGNKLQVMVNPADLNTIWSTSLTQSAALNNWYHVALVRQSGVCKFYLNGTLQNIGSGANPSSYPSTSFTSTQSVGISTVTIGSGFTGYIDDTRITNGVARYTTNFTAPVTSFKIK
jgi:hypothetical protein